ncbi:hypothetical protein [Candidatus Albibeggiatoa sp. nov. NOAA]|uniref:hypothetical protein n=1 Tax=Candidatus Albibeggiatoa sp. nov. NOAA TaxID=3162724 RepID=UPI0032FA0C5B|nr:hypothetical protein [Thiotrichaceae bacterium]
MMKMYVKHTCMTIGLLCLSPVNAEIVPFDPNSWEFNNEATVTIGEYQGQSSVLSISNGIAVVTGSAFTNGTIEYDVYNSSEGVEYAGAIWHVQDLQNFEAVHTRNNRNNTPYAVHYYPFNNNIGSSQLYYGQGHNAATNLPLDQWSHVKIVISGNSGELFINDMTTPILLIENLVGGFGSGQVGLFGNYNVENTVHYANFDYQPSDTPPALVGIPEEFVAEAGVINTWSVSEPFAAEVELQGYELTPENRQNHTFTTLVADRDGKTNLARLQPMPQDQKTVFARAYVNSNVEQMKKFSIGFTGEIDLYLNGKRVYAANDTAGSRDHAFLGSSGYVDHLYLPLVPGNNEIWAAITGSSTGWGVLGKFDDMTNLAILDTPTAPVTPCAGTYDIVANQIHLPCVSIGDGSIYDVTLGQDAAGNYQLLPEATLIRAGQ